MEKFFGTSFSSLVTA